MKQKWRKNYYMGWVKRKKLWMQLTFNLNKKIFSIMYSLHDPCLETKIFHIK